MNSYITSSFVISIFQGQFTVFSIAMCSYLQFKKKEHENNKLIKTSLEVYRVLLKVL